MDDLQEAREGDLDALHEIMDEYRKASPTIVCAFRDPRPTMDSALLAFLGNARRLPSFHECRLEPLTPDDTLAMAENALGGEATRGMIEAIREKSDGIPLLVRELCRSVASAGRPRHGCGSEALPYSAIDAISEIVACRIRGYSPVCAAALETACLVGESFKAGETAAIDGESERNVQAALGEAVDDGFLSYDPASSSFRFSHALMRETLRKMLPSNRRREACRSLAATLEGNRTPEQLSEAECGKLADWWMEEGSAQGRLKARSLHMRLGKIAQAHEEHHAAAIHFRNAVDASDLEAPDGEYAEALFLNGKALLYSGDAIGAERLFDESFQTYRRIGRLDGMAEVAANRDYLYTGTTRGGDHFTEILGMVPAGAPIRHRLLLRSGIHQITVVGDYSRAVELLAASGRGAEAHGDENAIATLAVMEAFCAVVSGQYGQALEKLARTEKFLRRHPDEGYIACHYLYGKSVILASGGNLEEAETYAERLIGTALKYGDATKIGLAYYLRARLACHRGAWREAENAFESGLRIAPYHLRLVAHRALSAYDSGQRAAGDYYSRRLERMKKFDMAETELPYLYAAALDLARTAAAENVEPIHARLPRLEAMAGSRSSHPYIRERARVLLALGAFRCADARRARIADTLLKRENDLVLIRPYLKLRARALAAHAAGFSASAVALSIRARSAAEQAADRPAAAWIAFEQARIMHAAENECSNDTQARHALAAAKREAEELRMEPLAAAVSRFENSAFSPAAPDAAEGELSPREIEVLGLVGDGFTNSQIAERLFISPNTAANHIRAILRKTGSANRTEAAGRFLSGYLKPRPGRSPG